MKYPQLVSMPSAVSDWLEEQLEARGIDAVVYTRYILSLLYRDPIDVIYPDQDLQVTHPNKEVKRPGSNRKRIRRSSEWWGYSQADVDQLKRSAAVECLMSASEQKCGIESLVDELCAKLKEVNSNSTTINETPVKVNSENHKLSPQDQAKQYYAAFPPLSRNTSSPTSLITFIPKWFGSPKKKTKKQNRSASYDEKLHGKKDADLLKTKSTAKQKVNYFGRHKRDFSRNIAKSMKRSESMADWNLYMFNETNSKNGMSEVWPQQLGMMPVNSAGYINNPTNETNDENEECSWNDIDDNLNMYNDLPVDIRELLNSPVPQEKSVKMKNLANMHDTGNKSFINNGTNLLNSIWSNTNNVGYDSIDDNTYNNSLDMRNAETFLGARFSSLTLDNTLTSRWPVSDDVNVENERNLFAENYIKSLSCFNFDHLPINDWPTLEKWSDAECTDEEMEMFQLDKSLQKLDHNKAYSAFAEVVPQANNPFTVFNKSSSNINLTLKTEPIKKADADSEKDDLLTSERSHFRPISAKLDELNLSKYTDGTTFVIPSNLEKVDYKYNRSGYLYMEDDNGVITKYKEFRTKYNFKSAFVPKYKVAQMDKVCQTDFDFSIFESETGVEHPICSYKEDILFPGDHALLNDEFNKNNDCTCYSSNDNLAMKLDFSFGNDLLNCPVHPTRPDSVTAEIFGNYETKCEKCIKNIASWNSDCVKKFNIDKKYDRESEKKIWNGEICVACLKLNEKRPPLSQEQSQLRQELKREGEQLLSDISCIQKSYMEEMPAVNVSCELKDLLVAKEIKRRHSSAINYYGCLLTLDDHFSFASRLEQDCMNKLTSVIPTLRSVTL